MSKFTRVQAGLAIVLGLFLLGTRDTPAQPTGACCIGGFNPNAPVCEVLTREECAQTEAATYLGDGTVCSADSCQRIGPCCIGGFNPSAPICLMMTEAQCLQSEAGEFLGVGGVCTPDLCPRLGICCRGVTCRFEFNDSCAGPNTMFVDGSACGPNGDRRSPCCHADFNKVGGVSVQDIFDFLGAYFARDPSADFDGGGLSVQDVFDYLAAYFAGCE